MTSFLKSIDHVSQVSRRICQSLTRDFARQRALARERQNLASYGVIRHEFHVFEDNYSRPSISLRDLISYLDLSDQLRKYKYFLISRFLPPRSKQAPLLLPRSHVNLCLEVSHVAALQDFFLNVHMCEFYSHFELSPECQVRCTTNLRGRKALLDIPKVSNVSNQLNQEH